MNQKQIRAAVEAMLFACGDPIGADKLAQAVHRSPHVAADRVDIRARDDPLSRIVRAVVLSGHRPLSGAEFIDLGSTYFCAFREGLGNRV